MRDTPGVVTVHRFVQAKNAKGSYSDYAVGYMGRPEAFDEEKHLDDTLYHDSNPLRDVGGYMGNNEKTDGLFDANMDLLEDRDKRDYSEMFNAAQAADSCLYQTVISFDNDYLRAHGVDFSSVDGLHDIKNMTRLAVSDLIANSHLDERNAIWTGAIHTNTDNIHVHIAIAEIEKTKSLRDMLPEKAIDKMKSRVANMLMGDEKIIQLSDYLHKELPHEIGTAALEAGNELTALARLLPADCSWQYNRPSMALYRSKINQCVDTIIRSNPELAAKYADAMGLLEEYRQDVLDVYGHGKHSDRSQDMVDNKLADFYARAGNQLLAEAKELKRDMALEEGRENGLPGGPEGGKRETDDLPASSPPLVDEEADLITHARPSPPGGKTGQAGRPEGGKREMPENPPLPDEMDMPPEPDGPPDLGYAPDPPAEILDDIDRLLTRAEHGDAKAQYDLGMRALKGRGVEKDPALAFKIIKDSADRGNPAAQCKLAELFRDGIGTEQNGFHADEYFYKAFQGFLEQAEDGNAYANYRVAMMYEKGNGVPQDDQKYQDYLREAAYLGHTQSMYLLGQKLINSTISNFDEGIRCLEMAADKGHGKAASTLGQSYLSAGDNETAFTYMRRAAELGDRPATYMLGKMYRDGIGTPADAKKAADYLKQGANIFWTDEYKAARAYLYGSKKVEQDFSAALELLKEEAAKGNAFAMCDVGRIYDRGLGIDPDPDMAMKYYADGLAALLAVEEIGHDAYIQYRIGKMYRFGQGTEPNDVIAAEWFEKSADQGNQFAQYSLGGMYYRGQGVEQDFARAFELYGASAEKDNAFAAYELGKMYHDGIGTVPDVAESEHCFEQAFAGFAAIEKANPDDKIQYRLGKMLETGTGTSKDMVAAVRYYEKSAKLKNPNAQYALARIYLTSQDTAKVKQAIMWLKKSAVQQNPYARYTLGKLLADGKVIKQNHKAALICFRSIADTNPYAAYTAAKMYRDGIGTENSTEQADKYFTVAFQSFTAAENETPDANLEYRLATMLLSGEGCNQNSAQAVAYLDLAAGKEHPSAQYMLGKMYLKGDVVAKDEKQAFRLIKSAADNDHPHAAYTTGQMSRDGIGTEKDEQAAQRYFQKAFEAYRKGEKEEPVPAIEYRLGMMLLVGEGCQKNVKAAVAYLDLAAGKGHESAQYALGRLYLTGEDFSKDVGKAVGYLDASAAQGNQYAQYALGRLYLTGEDLPKDVGKAVGYLDASAAQGNQFAQYALGRLYLTGEDLPKDVGKAVGHLDASAAQGNQYAQYSLGVFYLDGKEVPKDVPKGLEFLEASATQNNPFAQYALGRHNLSEGKQGRALEWFRKSAAQGNEYAKKAIDYINRPKSRHQAQRQASIIPAKALSAVRRLTNDYNRRVAQLKREFDREMELEREKTQSLERSQEKGRSL
ncbi:relaxase MobL [Ethanoligenens sp.]|uniref:relaxase MobL n=1 Tax=Ethanoligenens sp. TaxID=2099655 RepID=UPI0039EA5952